MKKTTHLLCFLLCLVQISPFVYAEGQTRKRWLKPAEISNEAVIYSDDYFEQYHFSPISSTVKSSAPSANLSTVNVWDYLKGGFKLTIPSNNRVAKARQTYLSQKNNIQTLLARSEPYIYIIIDELKKRNMPLELALLPVYESAFDPQAVSPAKATGLWQIMPSTAAAYATELRKTNAFDPRKDIVESTKIAMNILQTLNKSFKGDWLLTLAAYNSGEGRIKKAIKQNSQKGLPTNYWSLNLPRETMEYIPKLLALSDIIKNNNKFSIKLPTINYTNSLAKIHTGKQVNLAEIAKLSGLQLSELRDYNPGHINNKTASSAPKHVMVPVSSLSKVYSTLKKSSYPNAKIVAPAVAKHMTNGNVNIAKNAIKQPTVKDIQAAKQKALNLVRYKVKKGDTLNAIALSHNVKLDDILEWNGIAERQKIKPGDIIKIQITSNS